MRLQYVRLDGILDADRDSLGYAARWETVETDTGLVSHVKAYIPASSPQPRQIVTTAAAWPNEGSRGPIHATARVQFDPMPMGPLLHQQIER